MTRPEQLLPDVLAEHADHATWEPTPVASVADRAGRVRRRRRAAVVAGVVVLVAAVVVPVSLVGRSGPDVSPAVAENPASAPPRIGYAVDDVYRVAGGGLVGLPEGTTTITATWENTVLVSDDPGSDGALGLHDVDTSRADTAGTPGRVRPVLRSGEGRALEITSSAPVVNGVSWAYTLAGRGEGDLTVDVWTPPGPTGSPLMTRGLPDGAVLLGVDRETQRIVFLQPSSGRVATVLPQQSPRTGTTVPGLDGVVDYTSATHLFADVTPDGRGGGVVDDTGHRLWEGEATVPGAFSPDGTRILTTAGDELQVRDARTGERLGVLPGAAALGGREALRDVVWEDDAHLLATRSVDAGRRELVRVGPGGTITPLDVPTIPDDAAVVWDTRP